VIGEIFDKVSPFGGLETEPLKGIQTISCPPRGAVIIEFKLEIPDNYSLVDHALARSAAYSGYCTSKDCPIRKFTTAM
jgi:nitrite reductase (NO-forming)